MALSERGTIAVLRSIKIFLLSLGVALLAVMIHRIGLENILQELGKLGLNVVWIFIPYFAVYIFDALGWRATLGEKARKISLPRLFMTRMGGEAINYITPSAYLAGEPVKAYLLQKQGIPFVDGLASVVTAKTVMVVAQVLFILLGIGLAILGQPSDWGIIFAALLIVILVSVVAAFLVFAQHRGMFLGTLWLMEKLRLPAGFLKRREEHLKALDSTIMTFYSRHHSAFFFTLTFFLVGWVIGSLEIYLVVRFLDLPINVSTAISLEALATVVRAAVFFIPGGIGAQEGGNILLFASYGLSPVTAMTFSIIRRLREATWIGIGLLYLAKQEIDVLKYPQEAGASPNVNAGPVSGHSGD